MKHMDLRHFVLTSLFVALTLVLGFTPLGIIPLGFINVTILHIPVIIGTILLGWRTGLLLGFFFGLTSTLRAFGIPSPASALVSTLMSASPLYVIVMSMVPRLLVPVVTHFIYLLISSSRAHLNVPQDSSMSKSVCEISSSRAHLNVPVLSCVADSLIFAIALPAVVIGLYALKLLPFGIAALLFALFAVFELLFAARTDTAALTISAVAGTLTNTVFYLGLMLLFYHLAGLDTAAVVGLITGTGIIAGGTEAIAAAVLTTPVICALKRVNTNA